MNKTRMCKTKMLGLSLGLLIGGAALHAKANPGVICKYTFIPDYDRTKYKEGVLVRQTSGNEADEGACLAKALSELEANTNKGSMEVVMGKTAIQMRRIPFLEPSR